MCVRSTQRARRAKPRAMLASDFDVIPTVAGSGAKAALAGREASEPGFESRSGKSPGTAK